jgi:DNA-directed RNA polymerase subunit RPC12/RpoP
MQYHPHVHYIVAGGGLSPDHSKWISSDPKFLVPVEPLALIFKAKFRDGLKKTNLYRNVAPQLWSKPWVVHSKPVGTGHCALKYLAPYVYRVAITNNRIEKLENNSVTFRFKDSDTNQNKIQSLPAIQFIRRFLQHVLPKGFVKIRYYGLLAPGNRKLLAVAKYLRGKMDEPTESTQDHTKHTCPHCGHKLFLIKSFPRSPRGPP